MSIIEISAVVAALALVVLTIVVIRISLEVNKTSAAARLFMSQMQADVKPVLSNMERTLEHLKVLSEGAAEKVDDVKSLMEAAGDTGRSLHALNTVVCGVTGLVSKSSLWMTGLKVAGNFLLERLSKKRG